ncbi:CcoQ/FixQ family Cbb3-type cytochrome c oxidase assembly chaperone [Achromobacter sp. GG226]|uniref:cbb3-type cytochrome oxidase subunit 3 n=1 Tax=Verticiella alkaliphila TaxID=2779529 RepID=UPI001C0B05B9|nr:CcoQ/FixQ family Cbb3-type cytochrome c oxidase assembly chaperone [Verticiella sp. GG226]MBU4609299.1 CcoQ/FixQ family Cbb3-type cytochrome c oxidase assembly chaperone [Verticiella sp. GG226]
MFDLTFLRVLFTLLAFAAFTGVVVWAWAGGRHDGFADAAALPFSPDAGADAPARGDAS